MRIIPSANLRYRLKTDTSDEVEADKLSSFSEMRSESVLIFWVKR